jgi:uncharacterized membrane-anchored protein
VGSGFLSAYALTYVILVSILVGGAIVSATTILRLYLRRYRLWWDDACALISMLFFIAIIVVIAVFHKGIGYLFTFAAKDPDYSI